MYMYAAEAARERRMDFKTVAQVNVEMDFQPYVRQNYETTKRIGVGRVGPARTGEKIHVVYGDRITSYLNGFEPTRRQYQMGDDFSTEAPCNGNGQQVGQIIEGMEFSQVTCKVCQRRLAKAVRFHAEA